MKEFIEAKQKEFEGKFHLGETTVEEYKLFLSQSLQEAKDKGLGEAIEFIKQLNGNRIKLGYQQLGTGYWTDKIIQQLQQLIK